MSLTEDNQVSKHDFIGDEIDSLVEKLTLTTTGIKLAWDIVKVTEAEKQDLQSQLFRYAEDMHKLIAERDLLAINESEKKAAYSQLERFNHDFMLLMKQKEKSYKALDEADLLQSRMNEIDVLRAVNFVENKLEAESP